MGVGDGDGGESRSAKATQKNNPEKEGGKWVDEMN